MNTVLVPGETTDTIFLSDLLKASPRMEGDRRFIFLEASNEARDQQNEVVLSKALKDSADYFLKFGNLDIDHYTIIGPKLGIPNYNSYEIGRPVDVRVDGKRTFVKGEIFRGEGPAAEKANEFWSSLTDLNPPQRWYPSVGGKVLEGGRSTEFDPETKSNRVLVKAVRWYNIGFSKTPVNAAVPTVSAMPFGLFAKSWTAAGLDLTKALEAGYGTDSATLSGGGAMRRQSLDGAMYYQMRDRLATDMLSKKLGDDPSIADLVHHVGNEGEMDEDEASDFVERFLRDLRRDKKN